MMKKEEEEEEMFCKDPMGTRNGREPTASYR